MYILGKTQKYSSPRGKNKTVLHRILGFRIQTCCQHLQQRLFASPAAPYPVHLGESRVRSRRKRKRKLPTSQRPLFYKRDGTVTLPADIPTAAAAHPARLPSPSFLQSRSSQEQPEWGKKGRELQLAPFPGDPARDPCSGCCFLLRSSEPRSGGRRLAVGGA